MAKKKKPAYSGGEHVTFRCIACGKQVTLPSWGRKRKYCSIACWTAESARRAKAKARKAEKAAKTEKSAKSAKVTKAK